MEAARTRRPAWEVMAASREAWLAGFGECGKEAAIGEEAREEPAMPGGLPGGPDWIWGEEIGGDWVCGGEEHCCEGGGACCEVELCGGDEHAVEAPAVEPGGWRVGVC